MKKLQLNKGADTKIQKRKGFYIALGLCLIAVGIAVYIGVGSTLDKINEDKTLQIESILSVDPDDPGDNADAKDVDHPQSDVPKEDLPQAKEQTSSKQQAPSQSTQPEPAKSAKALSFAFPLEGEVLNGFSNGELVKSKTLNEWRTHDGIDLKASAGTPVKAVCDGIIESIEEDPMWGVCITISHGDQYQSLYCGLKPNVPVKKGAQVKIGDIIGYVGNTAEIEIGEESHLHFAMKQDGAWIDPMSLIR